jgi:NADH:ubiquinone oxidoreductase subunit H
MLVIVESWFVVPVGSHGALIQGIRIVPQAVMYTLHFDSIKVYTVVIRCLPIVQSDRVEAVRTGPVRRSP